MWKTHEYWTTVSHILNRLSFYQRVVFFSHCCSLFCLCGFQWNNTQQMRIDFWQCEENSPKLKPPKPKGCKAVCLQNVYGWSHTWSNMSASYNTRLSEGILKCNQPYKVVFPGLLRVCSLGLGWAGNGTWVLPCRQKATVHLECIFIRPCGLWGWQCHYPCYSSHIDVDLHLQFPSIALNPKKECSHYNVLKTKGDRGHFVNKDQFIRIYNKSRNQIINISHNLRGSDFCKTISIQDGESQSFCLN